MYNQSLVRSFSIGRNTSSLYSCNSSKSINPVFITTSFQVQFSENYPSLSPPRYDLDAHWLRGPQRTRLQGRLDEAYL